MYSRQSGMALAADKDGALLVTQRGVTVRTAREGGWKRGLGDTDLKAY